MGAGQDWLQNLPQTCNMVSELGFPPWATAARALARECERREQECHARVQHAWARECEWRAREQRARAARAGAGRERRARGQARKAAPAPVQPKPEQEEAGGCCGGAIQGGTEGADKDSAGAACVRTAAVGFVGEGSRTWMQLGLVDGGRRLWQQW